MLKNTNTSNVKFTFYPSSRAGEKVNLVVKFRTSTGKMDAEKAALTAHIRLFEPMVIKALKVST